MKPYKCKDGSAWHAWQCHGRAWRIEYPHGDAERAAGMFAAEPGWPDAGKNARRRAFLEGVKLQGEELEE